jgi:hypothetical protein
MLAFPLSSTESSQSDESSSSSMALSSTSSSSSSVSKTSSSNGVSSRIVRVATSSWKEVCFLANGFCNLCVKLLWGCIRCGRDASSSFDDPPKLKTANFFFCGMLSIEAACSLSESSPDDPPRANICFFFGAGAFEVSTATKSAVGMEDGAVLTGMDRIELLMWAGESEKPFTMLVALFSDVPLDESDRVDGIER